MNSRAGGQFILNLVRFQGVALERSISDKEVSMIAVGSQYNLGQIAMIPVGEGRVYEIGNAAIAIFRTKEGAVYATQALCPHRDGPLVDGIIGAGKAICPLHSFTFDLASGNPIGNDCQALVTYPVSLSASGDILLTLKGQSFEV
jgi:nitrite reductase (NADH) small subunit